ncbi:hypothetical protein HPG69_017712, partial [Diceros bicornis minor]
PGAKTHIPNAIPAYATFPSTDGPQPSALIRTGPHIKAALSPQTASALRCIVAMTSYTQPLLEELGHRASHGMASPCWPLKHLLGSHSPVQKLFADAQPRFPKPPHCFQTGQAGWGGEARPRETVFPVLGRGRACDTGPWQLMAAQGELDVPPIWAEAKVVRGPGGGPQGAESLDEDRVWIL